MAEEVISKKKSSLKDEWKTLEEKLMTMIAELEDLGSCLDHFFIKMGHSRPLFLYFRLLMQLTVKQINVQCNGLSMTGFEPRTTGVESECSTNFATTTALTLSNFL